MPSHFGNVVTLQHGKSASYLNIYFTSNFCFPLRGWAWAWALPACLIMSSGLRTWGGWGVLYPAVTHASTNQNWLDLRQRRRREVVEVPTQMSDYNSTKVHLKLCHSSASSPQCPWRQLPAWHIPSLTHQVRLGYQYKNWANIDFLWHTETLLYLWGNIFIERSAYTWLWAGMSSFLKDDTEESDVRYFQCWGLENWLLI